MKKNYLAALLAAFALLGFSTPASAKSFSEKEAGLSAEEKANQILAGQPAFYGTRRNGDIIRWNPLTSVLTVTTVIRPHGHNENSVIINTYCAPNGVITTFKPDGFCAAPMGPVITTHTTNGNATLGRALAAVIPSVIGMAANHGFSKLFGVTCSSGGGCGKGSGSIFNVSASAAGGAGGNAAAGASSTSSANLTSSGDGTCPTTGC